MKYKEIPFTSTNEASDNQDTDKSTTTQIKECCLRLLARREHSQKELLNKLLLRNFNKDEILAVIEDFALQGWQSDLRYAESYARSRIQKGYGPVAVTYELRKNGIEAFNLDDVVQQTVSSWMVLLEQVYSKKYGQDLLIDRNEWAKRSRFLMQRGFSGTMISALFDHLNIKF
ncbi:regulatory protein RecX [Methylobacter psychrophilus]|uniref:regulatory protein RecX n=1 Tax=Methylobacter psychrophilus TaxID=96941 RepID=UPI0021D48A4B|nr:regulatory protein RecX [Methylobacter psychrophilus]